MHQLTKFYILLLLAVVVAGSIFALQFTRAKKISVKPADIPILSEGYYNIVSDEDDQILGNPGAAITITIFSDLSCADCKQKYNEVATFVREHPQDVRLILKHTPRPGLFFKTNDLPQRSAFCAGKQGKYWEYVDILNGEKQSTKENALTAIADNLKLNTVSWWQCVNSEQSKQKINYQIAQSQSLGIETLPAIYINNKRINLENDINLVEILTKFIAK
jgi:protein-disulfide isomerase